MIVERHIKFSRVILIIWKRILKMTALSSAIVIPILFFDLKQLTIGMTTPLVLGTAIAIFLGFRTNSAYDRWFSGRVLFGDLIANGRNFGLILARVRERYQNRDTGAESSIAQEIMPRMIRRTIAYTWMLGYQLKDLDPLTIESIDSLLTPQDIEDLKTAHNPALRLLFKQEKDFRRAASEGQFLDGEHFEVVAIMREFTRIQTACEGLKNTPFPTHYTYFTDVFVWLLIILLSLSLPADESSGYYAIPLVVLIGWIFSMIEGIGDYMDYPWANNRNVVPTNFLSRNLEIDLRSYALQESDLPLPLTPDDGALY